MSESIFYVQNIYVSLAAVKVRVQIIVVDLEDFDRIIDNPEIWKNEDTVNLNCKTCFL